MSLIPILANQVLKQKDQVDYCLLLGQSNMSGRMNDSALVGDLSYLAGQMIIGDYQANILNKATNDTNFEILEAGVNTSDNPNQLGIQPELAYRMILQNNKDFNIIQAAFGGTTINLYSKNSSNFQWILEKVQEVRQSAINSNKIAKIKAIIWIQGESNGGDSTGTYEGLLRALIKDYRTFLQLPNLPFIIVQMIDCQTDVVNLSELQATQSLVALENNNYLISKESSVQTCRDPLHFSDDKYLSVANKIFEIIKDI